jgi:hypothetical protein
LYCALDRGVDTSNEDDSLKGFSDLMKKKISFYIELSHTHTHMYILFFFC